MKKKIMIGAFAALFLSVGIFIATTIQEKEKVSDLTLANIEAMTNLGIDEEELKTLDIHSTEGFCYVYIKGQMIQGGAKPLCQAGSTMSRLLYLILIFGVRTKFAHQFT